MQEINFDKRDKFMPEMHLWQSRFMFSACVLFIKNKKGIHIFKETRASMYIYKSKLDETCFQFRLLMTIIKIYIEDLFLINL